MGTQKNGGLNLTSAQQRWADAWRSRPGGWWDDEEIVVGGVMGDWQDDEGDLVVNLWHRDYPGWTFLLTFSVAGTLVAFTMVAPDGTKADPPVSASRPPITARLLRNVPVGALEREARRFQRERVNRRRKPGGGSSLDALDDLYLRVFAERERPRRRARGPRDFLAIAVRYVELLDESDSPTADLAKEFGLSPRTMDALLRRIRHIEGLLTEPPTPGKPGGTLTRKALDMLEGDDDGQH